MQIVNGDAALNFTDNLSWTSLTFTLHVSYLGYTQSSFCLRCDIFRNHTFFRAHGTGLRERRLLRYTIVRGRLKRKKSHNVIAFVYAIEPIKSNKKLSLTNDYI